MFETIFEVGINALEMFIVVFFITEYLGCKHTGTRKYIGFFTAWFVLFAELCVMNHYVELETIGAYIPVVIYFIYSLIQLRGSVLLKLWVSVLTQIVLYGIAIFTNMLFCNVFRCDPTRLISSFNWTRVVFVLTTKVILIVLVWLILKYKHKNPIDNKSWLMLMFVPAISVISLGFLLKAAMLHHDIIKYTAFGMGCIVLANVMMYYFFSVLNKNYETKMRLKLLEQQNANAKQIMDSTDAFVNQMRTVKHDIKNQMLIIRKYIEENNRESAKEYVDELIDTYIPDMQSFVNTDNEAFDAIINAKIAICHRKHIYMEVKCDDNSLDCMEPFDIAALFGNLLDNAIEAAEKTKKRHISVSVTKEDEYMSAVVSNSIDKSVLDENEELHTSKTNKSKHGIGIKTIRSTVNKYDGFLEFNEEHGEFCCHILINLKGLKVRKKEMQHITSKK